MRRFLVPMLLCFAAPASDSAVVTYADNRAGFLAATGAASIGALPVTGGVSVSGSTVGTVTFTNGPDGAVIFFNDRSEEIPGNEVGIGDVQNFNMAIAGGAYAIGFGLHEPSYVGGVSHPYRPGM